MKKKLFLLFIFILTLGCGTRVITKFVVQRDTPQSPVFIVMPYNEYYDQVDFAHRVEEVLVKLGVKTEDIPAVRKISKTKKEGSEAADAKEESSRLKKEKEDTDEKKLFSSGKKAEETTEEVYFAYTDSAADFIIFTNILNGRLRIVEKKSKEVVATFQITTGSTVSEIEKEYLFEKIIHDALEAKGIVVKDLPKPNFFETTDSKK